MISRKYEGLSNVIGKQVELLRKSKGWSRSKLSDELMLLGIDINYDSIYKLENCNRIVKDFELAAIAKVLGVSEIDLLDDFRKNIS